MPIAAPELTSGVKAVQVPSGVGVLPVRTLSAKPVPAGSPAVHAASTQETDPPASSTWDTKVPEAAYGLSRIQSIVMAPPPTLASLAIGRSELVTATLWEATCVPSTK